MTFKTTKLRDAINFALVGATALMGTGVAFAQENTAAQGQQATNLDRIEVTGSRIRQVELETAQPVLVISREDIQNQGFNSVADILQNISAAGAPTFSRTSPLTSNQEAGGQYIDLRNLGAQRTLRLSLRNPDLTTSRRVALAINDFIGTPCQARRTAISVS